MSIGLLTAKPSVTRQAIACVNRMDLDRPYLIETLARMFGLEWRDVRNLMWVGEHHGRITRKREAGRTYYVRVK